MSHSNKSRNYHLAFFEQWVLPLRIALSLRLISYKFMLSFSLLCFGFSSCGFLATAAKAETPNSTAALAKLIPRAGFQLSLFASDVTNARLMELTHRGDVIVSQPGQGVVSLLYGDADSNGSSDGRKILLKGLRRPHGLLLDGDWLYIALETSIIRYKYDDEQRRVSGKSQLITNKVPGGGHSTRTIRKGPDGWIYFSIGSSCNVCIERDDWRATILRFHPDEILKGGKIEIYARGLRNSVGFDWQPNNGDLYATDNGRDWLGDDLPPGEVNKITQGGFYGWPFFYGKSVADAEFGGRYKADEYGQPIDNVHEFMAHVAPLSLRFLQHNAQLLKLRANAKGSALVGLHGSWNRSVPSGYKVVMLGFDENGKITQSDFLSGFLLADRRTVIGRPVDSLELADGSILISDDYGGVIWKMAPVADKGK